MTLIAPRRTLTVQGFTLKRLQRAAPARAIVAVFAVFFLTSCAKSTPTLTSDQKTQFQDLLESTGRAYYAAESAALASNGGANGSSTLILSAMPNIPPSVSDSAMLGMSSALRKKDCQFSLLPAGSDPENSLEPPAPKTYLSLSAEGSQCPIELEYDLETQIDLPDGTWVAGVDYSYQAKDPSYAALNDVTSIDLSGSMDFSQTKAGADAQGTIDVSGIIHSTSQGDILLSISGTLTGKLGQTFQNLDGELDWNILFPNFLVTIQEIYSAAGVKYLLNGDQVPATQFESLLTQGGDPIAYLAGPDRIK